MQGKETMEDIWNRSTVPLVFQLVSSRLPQRDVISLLLVSPSCYRALLSHQPLWQVLDLHEMNNAGKRLMAALSLSRYRNIKQINLEFAQDIEDRHLVLLGNKCMESLQELQFLNVNGCQKISDSGIEAVTSACPKLKAFSIYWNVRVTDLGIKHLVKNCKEITDLNLSGCKNISDQTLHLIADNYWELEVLNLTRCIKLTDGGLQQILLKCSLLQSLNLYALSSFTDDAYEKIALLPHLRFLDLCGAQNLSDKGLSCIAKCKNLLSLNLTWCVQVTDVGVIAIAKGCASLEFLSLFGIVGVTDQCLKVLSRFCSNTLTTLDVNGCIGIKVTIYFNTCVFFSGEWSGVRPTSQKLTMHESHSHTIKIRMGSELYCLDVLEALVGSSGKWELLVYFPLWKMFRARSFISFFCNYFVLPMSLF